ncbi:MAG: hypothetical protein OEN56_15000 [Gemmatimonadota bacterium]|nr:hypothetical protein [Gemmatimonadota bacterium]
MSSGRGRGRWWVGSTRIKRIAPGVVAGVLTMAAAGTFAARATAQAPDERWRTLETEHFRVTFPEHLEELGRKSADRAERAWDELAAHFIAPPDGPIDVLVTDHADVSNGFAQVTPSNRITVFARPPVDAISLGFSDEWLELVITHELVHIVHLDHVVNPIGRLGRAVLGRVPSEWPLFPELGTPRWVTEGLATWYESRLTEAGRVKGSYHDMQIRTAALEGRFEDIGQASGESPLWPGGNRPYAYGSLFFEHLLDKFGEERLAVFVDAIGGQWIPYRLDSAGRRAFGVSLTEEWGLWRASVEADLSDLDRELERFGPLTDPQALTTDARWALYPQVSPDGRWLAYTRSDGRSDMQIRVIDLETGTTSSVGRTNQLATFSWIDDDRLLVGQLELDGPYRFYDDLYVFERDGGQTRLTRGARIGQPSVSSDGRSAIAVRQGDGTNELVRVALPSAQMTTLVPAEADVHWAFPSLSPDGRWIAATRFEPNARHDVVVLDARSGDVVARVTDDRALDMAPRWSPDGRWLVWASDRSGILNVYGAAVDAATGVVAAPLLLTNVRTGAAYPSVDPTGSWLYYSGYHVDGWEVERVPFAPDRGRPRPALASSFEPAQTPPGRGLAEGDVRPYSAGATLRPWYWELSYRAPIETPRIAQDSLLLRRRELVGAGLGIQTTGRDLVGRHSYSAFARISTRGRKVDGGLSYAYAGLGNPILSLSASQGYRDGGQLTTRSMPTDPLDTLFVLSRERSLEGAVTILAPTWRRNVTFTVSSGVVWERRQLLNVRLAESSTYRLARPEARLLDLTASVNVNTSRSHSFQMGTSRGLSLFLLGRLRNELSLPDSLVSAAGVDRSIQEVFGRVRGAVPLWRGGYAEHLIAFQAAGGISSGPGADALQYRVGGASGQPEPVTGLELFGGNSIFFPVRGYLPSSRFGRYAWAVSAEYRIPLWLINRGLRAWPVHVDRAQASIFFDMGNAWGPDVSPGGFTNPLGQALASAGAELTTELLGLYDIQARLRGGVAFPLVAAPGTGAGSPQFYVRVGLPF